MSFSSMVGCWDEAGDSWLHPHYPGTEPLLVMAHTGLALLLRYPLELALLSLHLHIPDRMLICGWQMIYSHSYIKGLGGFENVPVKVSYR